MSLFIDNRYAMELSGSLERFKRLDDSFYNFRCPVCGDSSINKMKTRGYFYRSTKSPTLRFKCHNCGENWSFATFLSWIDPSAYSRYKLDTFKASGAKWGDEEEGTTLLPSNQKEGDDGSHQDDPVKTVLKGYYPLSALSKSNHGVDYVLERMIPERWHSRIYYVDSLRELMRRFPKYAERTKDMRQDDQHIVIPLVYEGEVTHLICRNIEPNPFLRYMTLELIPDTPKVFNYDEVDKSIPFFVFEGPIDSMFVPNAMAMGGTTVGLPTNRNMMFVYDNEPRNREVHKIMNKAILAGKSLVIWDKNAPSGKDINEMVMNGHSVSEIESYLKSRVFSGVKAKAEMMRYTR